MLFDSLLQLIRANKKQQAIEVFAKSSAEELEYEKSLLLILNIILEGEV